MESLAINPTEFFTFESCNHADNVGCIVYENCILKKKMGQYEVGTKIEQITLEMKFHLETSDGIHLDEIQDLS